jgi:ubiquitin-conjugating enzyme E2 S
MHFRPKPVYSLSLQVIINESNISDIQAEYDGPAGTPFEGGLFRMKLVLGSDFPNAPPKGKSTHT